jgi:transcriptional regulator with XRE-family HTH domain
MLLAKRIKAIKEYKGFTQRQIMARLCVEQSTYSGYETESGNLKFTTVVKIAEALECSIPFLTDIYSSTLDEDVWQTKHHK